MKKISCVSVFLVLFTMNIYAQVVRTPQVFYTPAFSGECELIPDTGGWASLRHVLNQQEVPDFGHDWECGVNIGIFSSPRLAVYGLAEETFHFAAAPEPLGEWVFNPGSIISDLRLMLYLDLDPFLLESGFQHDCKHEVDRSSVRLQIHDIIFFILRPLNDVVLLSTDLFSLDTNIAVEGGINLPAVFQATVPQPDLGHLTGYFSLEGSFPHVPWITFVADGSVSATWRTEETTVTGLDPVGIDYYIRGGPALTGEYGKFSFYIGSERLTDTWADFDQEPVSINFITLELYARMKG